MNQMNGAHPAVGASTDPAGIYGEIRNLCSQEPSTLLVMATFRTYRMMEAAGR